MSAGDLMHKSDSEGEKSVEEFSRRSGIESENLEKEIQLTLKNIYCKVCEL